MKPLLPHPKPEPRERKRFDVDEWRKRGAAKYAKTAERRPVAPINTERRTKLREEQFAISSGYRAWVIQQPCAACGSYDREVGSQPAHVGKTRGAGAKAEHVLSLCNECHLWEHADRGGFEEAFFERHHVYPHEMALYRFETFHRERD